MIPESKYILNETVIRDLSLNDDILVTKKSTIRWLALSLGLINPNESRKQVFDLLETLIDFHYNSVAPTTSEILEKMDIDPSSSNRHKAIYYHLSRLQNSGLINRKKGKYYFSSEIDDFRPLDLILKELYLKRIDAVFSKISTASKKISKGV
jgi:DNA-binding transcriptional ArsR family regulator